MKLKKYKQFILLKEEKEELVKVDGVKFYHGVVGAEIKSAKDIDPLFRSRPEYIKNRDTTKNTASAQFGTGIYFGRNSDKIGPEDAQQYYNPNVYSDRQYTRGFMYEMTLKPDAKVVKEKSVMSVHHKTVGIDYIRITKEEYVDLRSKGIDAVSEMNLLMKNGEGAGLVLLNPDAVQTWKEVKRWEQPFDVVLSKYNPELAKAETTWKPGDILPEETIEVERKRFWDFDEVEEYVKKYLGDVHVATSETDSEWSKDGEYCISIQRPKLVGF
jgi:hypothetical protein